MHLIREHRDGQRKEYETIHVRTWRNQYTQQNHTNQEEGEKKSPSFFNLVPCTQPKSGQIWGVIVLWEPHVDIFQAEAADGNWKLLHLTKLAFFWMLKIKMNSPRD